MKKTLFAAASCVLALLICVISIRSYSSGRTVPEDMSASVSFTSFDADTVLTPGADPGDRDAMIDSGVYMLRGTLTKGDSAQEITITVDGDNIAVDMIYKGQEVRVMTVGGKSYLVCDGTKTYVERSDSLLDLMDIDPADLRVDPGERGTGGTELDTFERDGRTVRRFDVGGLIVERVYENGVLASIIDYDGNGEVLSVFDLDKVWGEIPAGVLEIPSDFEAESIYRFMKKYIINTENGE